jgi:hypothetical protein
LIVTTPPKDRMKQATRLGTVHFGKGPDEPHAPAEPAAETLPPNPAAFDPGPPFKHGSHGAADSEDLLEQDSPHALLEVVQPDVVDSIQLGMRSWFEYYFLTGDGTGPERIHAAPIGLRKASSRLQNVSNRLGEVDELDPIEAEFVDAYRRAVDGWAEAMTSIAAGIELDIPRLTDDGFALLEDAADDAKRVVRSPVYPNLLQVPGGAERSSQVGEALAYLAGLSPPSGASKVLAMRAKQPWERSIIAAGSPVRPL